MRSNLSSYARGKGMALVRSFSLPLETKQPVKTTITGSIPHWLSGSLFRNGPGVQKVDGFKLNHLFDGFAVVHRFDIKDREVLYQNKILKTEDWLFAIKTHRLLATHFGTVPVPDPCKCLFSRHFSFYFKKTDNVSVNIFKHGDGLFAVSEIDNIWRIDPQSLGTVEKTAVSDHMAVHMATAHPLIDRNGMIYNVGSNYRDYNQAFNILAFPQPANGELDSMKTGRIVASIPSRWKFHYGYIHSFGMAERYFVLLEQPCTYSLFKLLFRQVHKYSPLDAMENYENEQMLFHIIRKSDGKRLSTTYKSSDVKFCFHHINTYEEEGHLVVDICGYNDFSIVNNFRLENLRLFSDTSTATFKRFVLPIDVTEKMPLGKNLVNLKYTTATAVKQPDGSVLLCCDNLTEDPACPIYLELPQINYEACAGRNYRYVYGTLLKTEIIKIDILMRTVNKWVEPNGFLAAEPVFVPRPSGEDEDDGVILIPVTSSDPERPSYLAILDAHTLEEVAKADVPTDTFIPITFHGFFDPQQQQL